MCLLKVGSTGGVKAQPNEPDPVRKLNEPSRGISSARAPVKEPGGKHNNDPEAEGTVKGDQKDLQLRNDAAEASEGSTPCVAVAAAHIQGGGPRSQLSQGPCCTNSTTTRATDNETKTNDNYTYDTTKDVGKHSQKVQRVEGSVPLCDSRPVDGATLEAQWPRLHTTTAATPNTHAAARNRNTNTTI